ncbi:MAG: hypothetical protein AAGC68_00850 [Verrucomicrobiota bacterium]
MSFEEFLKQRHLAFVAGKMKGRQELSVSVIRQIEDRKGSKEKALFAFRSNLAP